MPGPCRHTSHSSAPVRAGPARQLCITGELRIAGDTFRVRYARYVGAPAVRSRKCLNLKLKYTAGLPEPVAYPPDSRVRELTTSIFPHGHIGHYGHGSGRNDRKVKFSQLL